MAHLLRVLDPPQQLAAVHDEQALPVVGAGQTAGQADTETCREDKELEKHQASSASNLSNLQSVGQEKTRRAGRVG
jgi:hypothetical protein